MYCYEKSFVKKRHQKLLKISPMRFDMSYTNIRGKFVLFIKQDISVFNFVMGKDLQETQQLYLLLHLLLSKVVNNSC